MLGCIRIRIRIRSRSVFEKKENLGVCAKQKVRLTRLGKYYVVHVLKSQSRCFGHPFNCVNNQLRNVQLPAQSSQRWHQQIGTNSLHNMVLSVVPKRSSIRIRIRSRLVFEKKEKLGVCAKQKVRLTRLGKYYVVQ